jgi:hypothetical protein
MENNKTAVEWLAEMITDMIHESHHSEFADLFESAKEMEKQEIMDAYSNGAEDEYNYQMDIQGRREDMDSETYFNNTYGKQQNA